MQLYVDGLPSNNFSFPPTSNSNSINSTNHLNLNNSGNFNNFNKQNVDRSENKSPLFSKIRKESSNEPTSGFPSRTFGGEKARMMFPAKDF